MSKESSKEKYALLDKLNLCHKCEKAKPAPNRKFCFDCLDKIREDNAKRYDSQKAHEYQARRREIYQEKKAKGICARCSKKATHGLYCYECSIKVKRRNIINAERRRIQRHERGLIPEIRKEKHLCLRCGKPIEKDSGKYFCESCCKKMTEYSKMADKSHWRNLENRRVQEIIWRINHV